MRDTCVCAQLHAYVCKKNHRGGNPDGNWIVGEGEAGSGETSYSRMGTKAERGVCKTTEGPALLKKRKASFVRIIYVV